MYSDKQTGIDTDHALMRAIETGVVDENEVGLHILNMRIDLDPDDRDPYTRAFLTVTATFADLEAEIRRDNTTEGTAASRE